MTIEDGCGGDSAVRCVANHQLAKVCCMILQH
ncbi:hypothetical protein L917_17966 [Phytophthora nicotianae]|uniref:Uncharacterized protein n=1 Tax=Phytophthora nicotianae TaxID=4792 RepID=W2K968_PHYNI|nr:hypothetical protein L915_18244 [Phytophthora nicotianae]ETL28516.1 hypothetical protein L916_18151 [Phytophthora nicotianae]ETL81771.1 hypothetical protein L917_17966 [Phytophthora nicotianae]